MAWGFAVGLLAAAAIYGLVLAGLWKKDVIGAVTRAWYTAAAIYLVAYGLVMLAALVHGITGVYFGGPYAESGLGYAVGLLGTLFISGLVFAFGFDIEVESKRLKKNDPYAEKIWLN